jgi:hypothetical protein
MEIWYWEIIGDKKEFKSEKVDCPCPPIEGQARTLLPSESLKENHKVNLLSETELKLCRSEIDRLNNSLGKLRTSYFKELTDLRIRLREKYPKNDAIHLFEKYMVETEIRFFDFTSTVNETDKIVFTEAIKELARPAMAAQFFAKYKESFGSEDSSSATEIQANLKKFIQKQGLSEMFSLIDTVVSSKKPKDAEQSKNPEEFQEAQKSVDILCGIQNRLKEKFPGELCTKEDIKIGELEKSIKQLKMEKLETERKLMDEIKRLTVSNDELYKENLSLFNDAEKMRTDFYEMQKDSKKEMHNKFVTALILPETKDEEISCNFTPEKDLSVSETLRIIEVQEKQLLSIFSFEAVVLQASKDPVHVSESLDSSEQIQSGHIASNPKLAFFNTDAVFIVGEYPSKLRDVSMPSTREATTRDSRSTASHAQKRRNKILNHFKKPEQVPPKLSKYHTHCFESSYESESHLKSLDSYFDPKEKPINEDTENVRKLKEFIAHLAQQIYQRNLRKQQILLKPTQVYYQRQAIEAEDDTFSLISKKINLN